MRFPGYRYSPTKGLRSVIAPRPARGKYRLRARGRTWWSLGSYKRFNP